MLPKVAIVFVTLAQICLGELCLVHSILLALTIAKRSPYIHTIKTLSSVNIFTFDRYSDDTFSVGELLETKTLDDFFIELSKYFSCL